MNEVKKDSTEQKIIEAAKTVFIKKGMDGARMQEIADEAGINKALLHYYFRSKQKLFEAIFSNLFQQIFPNILTLMDQAKTIQKRISEFLEHYLDILLKNPYLPAFVIKEINRDPQYFVALFRSLGIQPRFIFAAFEQEMDAGKIVRMDPRELMINLLSLCLFPLAAMPLMQLMMFENNSPAYAQFLKERKTTVTQFVLNSILIR